MHKIVNESCILVHMGCVVWSLYWICWVWKGWREPSIAPGGDILSGDALTCGWGMVGKVADPLALWPFCLPIVEEKKDGKQLFMLEDPSPVNFDFLQVCLVLYRGLCTLRCVGGSSNGKVTHWESGGHKISSTEITECRNSRLHNKF